MASPSRECTVPTSERGANLRIRKHFREAVDGPRRHANIIQALHQVGPRPLQASRLQQAQRPRSRLFTRSALVRANDSRASAGMPSTSTQVPELRVTADCNDHMAVRRTEHLVGNEARVRIAHAARRSARDQEVHRLVGEHAHFSVEQRQVDGRAFAGALTLQQRGLDGRDCIQAGEDVRIGHARSSGPRRPAYQ